MSSGASGAHSGLSGYSSAFEQIVTGPQQDRHVSGFPYKRGFSALHGYHSRLGLVPVSALLTSFIHFADERFGRG